MYFVTQIIYTMMTDWGGGKKFLQYKFIIYSKEYFNFYLMLKNKYK